MHYTYFTFEDFVADDYFRQWVKRPSESSSLFWQTFLSEHPEQIETVRLAVEAVQKLASATAALAEPADVVEKAAVWNNIRAQVLATNEQQKSPFLIINRDSGWRWLMAAASVLLAVGLGWWLQHSYLQSEDGTGRQPVTIQMESPRFRQKITTDKPQLVALPDGSSVILQKGSRLQYPRQFSGGKRIVHLTGEALFEVAKDRSHPFLVYANGLVTKVVGTSFNVKAYAADKDVVVTVRTGRVAVFAQSDRRQQQKASLPALEGVVLTPNQQLVFVRRDIRLTAPKVVTPTVARRIFAINPADFRFEAAPVSEVFARLEKMYGISVVYDKKTLGQCRLTADLTDEPLANKMLIICKSIEATYTITDTQLTISGPGCGA